MTHSPTIRLSHSSQTAKAVSAATDSAAIKCPAIAAVCRGVPRDRLNSQGEKKRIIPKRRLEASPTKWSFYVARRTSGYEHERGYSR